MEHIKIVRETIFIAAKSTTTVLRQQLEAALKDYAYERSRGGGGFEADRYKSRGRVEALADAWDALYDAGRAELRDVKVYEK